MSETPEFPEPKSALGYTAEEFAEMHGFTVKRPQDLFDAVRRNRPQYFEFDPETGCHVLPIRYHEIFLKELSSPIYQFLVRTGVDQYLV